jgi:hypothetical protein
VALVAQPDKYHQTKSPIYDRQDRRFAHHLVTKLAQAEKAKHPVIISFRKEMTFPGASPHFITEITLIS